jgi:hypothetical protein
MNYSKTIPVLLLAAAMSLSAEDTFAQSRARGRAPGGRSRGAVVGRAVPRIAGPARSYSSRVYRGGRRVYLSPRIIGYAPYRPYYYGYRPGITLGFYAGYGYPYGYPYYNGYRSYGYGSGYGYGYGYGPYGYPLPPPGYVSMRPGAIYGGVRIQGAPHDAQVFADGYYVGIVDDFDGVFQHLNLEAGPHKIEVRWGNEPPVAFDVNVLPGQTITFRMP